ncbi:MAG: methyl-accepting chemotaxis protein [Cyanobacteria bacterium]|nr:methyl-accepting chemotaxis protein [Cyanobacteriota bacterium]
MTSSPPNSKALQTPATPQRPQRLNGVGNPQANGRPAIPPPPPPLRRPRQEAKDVDIAQSSRLSPSLEGRKGKGERQFVRRWWQGLTLRSKSTLMAVLLGTLPIVAVGGMSYYIASQGSLNEVAKLETTRTLELQGALNLFLKDRLADIDNIAELTVLTDPTLRNQLTPQQKSNALDRFMANHGDVYSSIAFFDLNGEPIAQTSAGQRLGNHLNRTYIQAAKAANGSIISQPSISTTSGEFSIYTAAVVKDPLTNAPIGYVRARIPVTALDSLLATFKSDGSDYYIANQAGEVFFGSDGVQALSVNSAGQEGDADFQAIQIRNVFPEMAPFFDVGQPTAQQSSNTLSNDRQLVAFAPSQPLEGLPSSEWTAVISNDLSELLTPQRRLLIAISLGTLISAIAASGIALVIARRFTSPLVAATQAVKRIGQGDLTTSLTVEGQDEIAQLGGTINTMTGQLRRFTTEQQIAAQRSTLLASITTIAADLTSPEGQTALNQLLDDTRAFLKTDRVVIYRVEQGRRGQWSGHVSHESVNAGWPSALDLDISDPCIPAARLEEYREGRIYTVNDIHQNQVHGEHLPLLHRLKVEALLVVPIVSQNRLFGLLVTHHCAKSYAWQQQEIEFFQQLGQQLGVLMTVQQFAALAEEQRALKEGLQKRALNLMMEIDPVSKGDLTIRAKVTEDEIGTVADSYNATIASLRKIVMQVQTAAAQMSSTVAENQPLVADLSTGANQQTNEIAEALQQIQQMGVAISDVAASTKEAEAIVQKTTETVAASDAAMNRTVTGIMTIRETVSETAKKVKRLGESSQKISGVVNLISEFAAQTNLLALNASIEAARAGEEGRGFAVVAEEVRSLAKQSAEATVEIETLVASIQAETNDVVTAMEVGTEQVVAGTQLVDETRTSLTRIEEVAAQMNRLIASITHATQTQSLSSEAVTGVIQDVAKIAEQTSSEASQLSTSFQTLLTVAQTLQTSMSQFRVS